MLEGANEVCVKGYACVTIRCREDGAMDHILTCLGTHLCACTSSFRHSCRKASGLRVHKSLLHT